MLYLNGGSVTKRKPTITDAKRAYARWLIGIATDLRGMLTGNPDPEPLATYDRGIKMARALLLPQRKKKK